MRDFGPLGIYGLAAGVAGVVATCGAAHAGDTALTYISTATQNVDGSFVKKMGVRLPLLQEASFGMDVGFAAKPVWVSSTATVSADAPASVVWGRLRVSGEDTLPLWDTANVGVTMTPRDGYGSLSWSTTRSWKVVSGHLVASLNDRYWVNVHTLESDPVSWGASSSLRFEAPDLGTVMESGFNQAKGESTIHAGIRAEQKLPGGLKLAASLNDVLLTPTASFAAEKKVAAGLTVRAALDNALAEEPVRVFQARYGWRW